MKRSSSASTPTPSGITSAGKSTVPRRGLLSSHGSHHRLTPASAGAILCIAQCPKIRIVASIERSFGRHTRGFSPKSAPVRVRNSLNLSNFRCKRVSGHYGAIRLARGAGGGLIACYYDVVEHDIMFAWLPGPQIVSIEEVAVDSYQIDWSGEDSGVWIDRSPGLNPPDWTPAAGPLTGSSHTIGETAERMFYRLRAE